MGWPLDNDEAAQLDRQVRHLARQWSLRLLHLPEGVGIEQLPPAARRLVALAELASYEHLRRSITAQAAEAAGRAADAGADYTEIGDAIDMSRQGARRRWPNLADRTKAARAVAAVGQPPLSGSTVYQAGPPSNEAALDDLSDGAASDVEPGADDN